MINNKSNINNKRNKSENQEKLKKSLHLGPNFQNPEDFDDLSETDIQIFNEYILLHNACLELYPRQDTIAERVDKCVKTIYRSTNKLEQFGLMSIIYRHKKSNIYKLPHDFFNPLVRNKLKSVFWALKYIPLVWLLSPHTTDSDRNVRQYYNLSSIGYLYNKEQYNSHSYYQDTICKSNSVIENQNLKIKKEQYVNEVQFEYLNNIPGLNSAAKSQLSVFPLQILQEVFKILPKRSGISNPFWYTLSLCKSLCLKNNIKLPLIPETAQKPFFDWQSPKQKQIYEPKANAKAINFNQDNLSQVSNALPGETKKERIDRLCDQAFQEYLVRSKARKAEAEKLKALGIKPNGNLESPVELANKLAEATSSKAIEGWKNLITPMMYSAMEAARLWKKEIDKLAFNQFILTGQPSEEAAILYIKSWQNKIETGEIDNLIFLHFGVQVPKISDMLKKNAFEDPSIVAT